MKTKNIFAIVTLLFIVTCAGCIMDWQLSHIPNNMTFEQELTAYNLFEGEMRHLVPAEGVELFALSTPLFTDYAEKQRLLKLPPGTSMTMEGEGLPTFPDGAIIAKTFYYFRDATRQNSPKQIIETRLLIKNSGQWNVGVYEWNVNQDQAFLITEGRDRAISWINENGSSRSVNYHIPSHAECTTCHQSEDRVISIGPKLRNLNVANNSTAGGRNQLEHWRDIGWLIAPDLSNAGKLPDWADDSYSLNERARAYLDVNCAHCHHPGGVASHKKLNLGYDVTLKQSKIRDKKHQIEARMASDDANVKMPKLGTTIVHQEGLELIQMYVRQLAKEAYHD